MATLALATFRAEFPELDGAPDGLVQAKLDEAHRSYSEGLFGARYLDAVKYRTAELVAASPLGTDLRVAKGSPETLYTAPLQAVLAGVPASPISLE